MKILALIWKLFVCFTFVSYQKGGKNKQNSSLVELHWSYLRSFQKVNIYTHINLWMYYICSIYGASNLGEK